MLECSNAWSLALPHSIFIHDLFLFKIKLLVDFFIFHIAFLEYKLYGGRNFVLVITVFLVPRQASAKHF
jgi:hypothetical protein